MRRSKVKRRKRRREGKIGRECKKGKIRIERE